MKVLKVNDYDELSEAAYEILESVIIANPRAVINTTTGKTYEGMFEKIVEGVKNKRLDISDATFMNLDEYISERDAKFSVYRYMHEKLYDELDVEEQPRRIELLDGSLRNIDSEINRYKQVLMSNPRDLQIVGLGTNGHLGANEPGTDFNSRLFLAESDESTVISTIKNNNLKEEAPSHMITLGLADIMEADLILLAASGKSKAKAVRDTLEGPIVEDCPATILRCHPNVIFIIDEEAAQYLENDYHV